MTPVSKYTIGLRYGFIAGLLYVILLFCRYKFFASNPLSFVICAVVSYLIILMMYLFTGIARKKELGGYADFKEIFTSIFIAILITEGVYIVFNLVYFKFVDPSFWKNFEITTTIFLQKQRLTDEQVEQQMKSFKDMGKQTNPFNLIKGYGTSVIIDCVFGLIFASILRKSRPATVKISEEPKSL
jgi:FlaA1/EpsC-like NDP-sugar epimerase